MSSDSPTEAQVRSLMAHLEKLDMNEPSKVLSLAERILSIAPAHPFATHCKGIAQLQMGKVDAAKATLQRALDLQQQTSGASANDEIKFHLACADYRGGRYQEALDLLSPLLSPSRVGGRFHLAARHLSAQCLYNLESYAEAARLYEAILSESAFRDEQDKLELITNLTACYAGCDPSKVAAVVAEADEKTSDLLYNAATAAIEVNDLARAASLLQAAEAAARREHRMDSRPVSPDDLAEKSYFNDVAAILVQRAYLAFVRGDESEAEAVLKHIIDRKPSSISTYAVACINWAAIQRQSDFFETHRRLKHAQTPHVSQKLTKKQRLIVAYNNALLLLHTGKLQPCGAIVDRILRDSPDSPLGPLAKAALLLKEKGPVRAEAYLTAFLQENQASRADPSYSQLLLAQLWLEQGNLPAALKYLAEASAFVEGSAAAIATLANGYAECGDMDAAKALLKKHISGKKVQGVEQFAAAFFLRHGLLSEAAEAYRALIKSARGPAPDVQLLAGLAASVSLSDPEEAHSMARDKLLTRSGDVGAPSGAADEQQGPLPRAVIEEKGYKRRTEADAELRQLEKKKKRQRPLRRPPAVKVTGAPDPERWVPLSMRPSMKNLPPRRIREMKRLRAAEQEAKRKVHLKRVQQQEQASSEAGAVSPAPPAATPAADPPPPQ